MTIISNIHYNLLSWVQNTNYTTGNRINAGGNAYQCVTSGKSAGSGTGPTGTGSSIIDNTVTWKYLSSVDFTKSQDWINNYFGETLTDSIVGQIWNNGLIAETIATGIAWIFMGSVTPSKSNTITLTTAPGESFVDYLQNNPSASLAFNANNGVAVSFVNGVGQTNWIDVVCPFTTISKLQLLDPNANSQSRILAGDVSSPNVTFSQLLVDSYCQSGFDTIVASSPNTAIINCLTIDRTPAGNTAGAVVDMSGTATAKIVNCTFTSINPITAGTGIFNNNATANSLLVRNTILIGQSTPISGGGTTACSVDHCLTNQSSLGINFTDAGGNLLNKAGSLQFISNTSNFRLLSTSSCVNAGVTDTINIPTSIDIIGTSRPQQTSWDIGAYEYVSMTIFNSIQWYTFIL